VLFADLLEIHDPEPHAADLNMAIDEELLRQNTRPTLRIYRWLEPAVSFGYFGKIADAEMVAQGRPVVRRWTGGGIVEHGEDLTYTLIVPREHPMLRFSAIESYRMIHEVIAGLLSGVGMRAEIAGAASAPPVASCFAQPVQYDVVMGAAKLAGAAQRRTRWGMLHQGSVQSPEPLEVLCDKLAAAFSDQVSRQTLAASIEKDALRLVSEKYGTPTWLRKY
jgi:lipoate-protein ligase A